MSYEIVETRLASAVADSETVDVSYPTGTDAGTFKGAVGHKMMVGNVLLSSPEDFTLTFGADDITITNAYGSTWTAGSRLYLELQTVGDSGIPGIKRTIPATLAYVNLGAPDALVADGVCESQNLAAAGDLTLDGALVVGGAAVFDVPRNVVVDSGGADDAVLTVYGTDEYGQAMVENITMNGSTAVAGKKAFKRVTRIAASKAIANGAFVGTGDVLGLPFFLQEAAAVIKEIQDDAAATAGTLVEGVTSEATATTGDVRGTYDPNAACDGSKVFRLIVAVPDPTYKGVDQYAG